MSILGPDNNGDGQPDDERVAVAQPPAGSFGAVVAVDTPNTAGTNAGYAQFENLAGSGIAIGSNFFLTANHVMNGNNTARVTLGSGVPALPARGLDNDSTTPRSNFVPPTLNLANVTSFTVDMALLETTVDVATDATALGMVVFLDHNDLSGLQMVTAGYPIQGTPTPDPTGRTMFSSTDVIKSTTDTTIHYNADTQGGQSGSGVWLDSSLYSGALQQSNVSNDLLAGIHTNAGNTAQRISKDIYKSITDAMETATGANVATDAAALPENVIVGTEQGFFSFVTGSGEDYIQGSYRKELIIGRDGDDRLEGGGGDDRLEGGEGIDQALFSGLFNEYDFTVTDSSNVNLPSLEFTHARPDTATGKTSDGKDSTKAIEFAIFEYNDSNGDEVDDDNIEFFVPLLLDPDDKTKLKDGPGLVYEKEVKDTNDATLGTITAELPAFMFDGDLEYTLTIGGEKSTLYNFVYVVDSSGSMSGNNITQTKTAYQTLTQSLIDQGIADRSNFAVVDFDSSARLIDNLDAQGAISAVNALSAGGGTNFGPALTEAENWFESLPEVELEGATNIAYFLSDGFGSGASDSLQTVGEFLGLGGVTVDVRAFGIGSGADLNSLNTIDSNSAVGLASANDLIDAFAGGTIEKDKIDRIDVKLDGTVVDTIAATELVEEAGNLVLKDKKLEGLTVTREAENKVEFEVFFNDGTPSTTVEALVTTGQKEVRNQSDDGTELEVTFSVAQEDYNATGVAEIVTSQTINGNDLANTITIDSGSNTLKGNGGNDRFVLNGGNNVVDGGEGTDTAVFAQTQAEAGTLKKNGDVISIGGQTSLVDVEFVQFSDGLLNTSTLAFIPIVTLASAGVIIAEDTAGTSTADFVLNLSAASANDVVVAYSLRDGTAKAGSDYVAASGSLTIAAGQTQATLPVTILDDALIESDETLFVDFSITSGATFAENSSTATGAVKINETDSTISLSVVGDFYTIAEGASGAVVSQTFTLERFGSTSSADTIEFEVSGTGANSAQATDFVGGFPKGQVTFAEGETSKEITIQIAADGQIESDETFNLTLKSITGSATVPADPATFTIVDALAQNVLVGTVGDDVLTVNAALNTITSDTGNDKIQGALANFFGDVVTDFTQDDEIIFLQDALGRSSLTFDKSTGVIAVDSDGDGTSEGSFTLEGDFSTGDFMAAQGVNDTNVTFEAFLPSLTEQTAVDANVVNGVANQAFLTGNGSNNFRLTMDELSGAGYNNAIGVYEVDASGNMVDVRLLINNANTDTSATADITGVDAGNKLGFFLVQDGASWADTITNSDTFSFIDSSDNTAANVEDGPDVVLAVNGATAGQTVFHSFADTLNVDGLQHVLSGVADGGRALKIGFEDLTGGGDKDYQDVVFSVETFDII